MNVLNSCTQRLFGVSSNLFAAAVQGNNTAPGLNGLFAGTLTDSTGLQLNFRVLTGVNSTADEAYSHRKQVGTGPIVQIAPGYVDPCHPFVNFVRTNLNPSETPSLDAAPGLRRQTRLT